MSGDQWIFGYGSLVWRPAFEHLERRPGWIRGYVRRFWQASSDHRGTPEAPGRVVTLHPAADQVLWGMAYRVAEDCLSAVLQQLDFREQAGYERVRSPVTFVEESRSSQHALVYIAAEGNQNYVGPAPLEDIAAVVRTSVGPSGSNLEYVVRLHEALEEMGAVDEHVAELARLVTE